jgi:predicted O-methyltransferase YrrM
MKIVPDSIDAYMHKLTPPVHAVLTEMEKLGAKRKFPIVGPLVGRILFQLGRLSGAMRIMELGSGFGYSAFWWALATPPEAVIHCTELSPENIELGKDFLSRAQMLHKIDYRLGDALDTLDQISGEFDIVFMDADKVQYPEGFRKAFPRIRKGGLFVTDNVLWSGKVVGKKPDATTKAVLEYNELIYNTPGAFSTILPVRDGVAVTYKD